MKIDDLKPAPYNPRSIDAAALGGLKTSLDKFGDIAGIVWNRRSGCLVAGHQRLAALQQEHGDGLAIIGTVKAGLALVVPGGERFPIRVVDWDEAKERAANVAANNPHIAGVFDDKALGKVLDGLKETDWGEVFQELRFDELQPTGVGEVVEDEVPEPPDDPITKPGDLWIMCEHRVLCGDATKAEDVAHLLDGRKPFIMVTDPPYGVEYDTAYREKSATNFAAESAKGIDWDTECDWREAIRLFAGSVAYLWHASLFAGEVKAAVESTGLVVKQQVIWHKPFGVMSRNHYHFAHETCWYSVRKNGKTKWNGSKTETTVWDATIPNHPMTVDDDIRSEHPTQKPVEVMARPIRNHGGKDDDIYDPFLGSGTTLIAAEQLGRKLFGIEIEPRYCDVIVKRWENLTGKKAERIPATS